MSLNLRILICIVSIVLALIVLVILKRGRMPLKYSLIWLLPVILLLLLSIMPNMLWQLTKIIGFETTSNMVIGFLFLVLFYICIVLTIIISGQNTKITLLIQEVSILKSKMEKKNKQHD